MAKPTQISLFDLDAAESNKPAEDAVEAVPTSAESLPDQVVEEPAPPPMPRPDIPERAPRPPKVIMVEVPDPEPPVPEPVAPIEPVEVVQVPQAPVAETPVSEFEWLDGSEAPALAPDEVALPTFTVPAVEPNQQASKVSDQPGPSAPATRFRMPKRNTTTIKSTRGRKPILDDGPVEPIDVPADDVLFQKLYYPIGQVAEMFNVNASLIRLWENEFDILKPRKNGKGDRLFRPEDIKNLQLIHHLIREKKYTMAGAKDYLKRHKAAETRFALIESLQKLQAFLRELKAGL